MYLSRRVSADVAPQRDGDVWSYARPQAGEAALDALSPFGGGGA